MQWVGARGRQWDGIKVNIVAVTLFALINLIEAFRLALGSFIEEYSNKVQVVALDPERSVIVLIVVENKMFDKLIF